MDRISDLRLFMRVAETLSFTRTAAVLGVSRASVGRTIDRLEAQLGTRLIQRTTRSVALTPDGALFLKKCSRLVTDADTMETMFAQVAERPRGLLRVNVPTRMARLLFAPRLPEFLARYPEIELDFAATDRPVDLITEGFDCVVRVGEKKSSGLISRSLGALRMINCASPIYLETRGIPQSLEELQQHDAVGYVSPRDKRDVGWEHIDGDEVHSFRTPCSIRVNNAELYIACALAGLGLIQVPAYDVQALIARGDLVEVLTEYPSAPMPIALVAPDRPSQNAMVRVFANWAEEICRGVLD